MPVAPVLSQPAPLSAKLSCASTTDDVVDFFRGALQPAVGDNIKRARARQTGQDLVRGVTKLNRKKSKDDKNITKFLQ